MTTPATPLNIFDEKFYGPRTIHNDAGTMIVRPNGTRPTALQFKSPFTVTYNAATDRYEVGGSAVAVASVNVNAPIQNLGTALNPIIWLPPASGADDGYMTAAHYTLLNGATSSATANTLAKRNANEGVAFSYIDLVPTAPIVAEIRAVGPFRIKIDGTVVATFDTAEHTIGDDSNVEFEHFRVITAGEFRFYENGSEYFKLRQEGGAVCLRVFSGDGRFVGTDDQTLSIRIGTTDRVIANSSGVAFNGGTPQAPLAITQNYTTTSTTVNAYTSDDESVAYTGIDNAQPGTVYATVADLDQLRVAYETLRASHDNLLDVVTALVDHLQARGDLT